MNTAMRSLGRAEGECFPWIRRVVREATGRTIGYDYRAGYLEAGAIEVTAADARAGDLVQLVDDANTAPIADYPGLHSAIVLENLGGGRFRAIDSNSQFDGIVRFRDYEPFELARKYPSIVVHFYRIGDGSGPATTAPGTSQSSQPSPRPAPPPPGTLATITADGDCLRLRNRPSLAGDVLTCLPDRISVTVLGAPAEADGYHWQQVAASGLTGWVASIYLAPAASAGTASGSPASAAAGPARSSEAVSTRGKVTAGSIPPSEGFGLFVFGGGTNDELVSASGCPRATAAFWVTHDGDFVSYIPAASVAAVNAKWNALFAGGLPPGATLIGRCA